MEKETARATIDQSRYKTQIMAGGHQLTADESVENGGSNLGPDPSGLLASSLAACTAITLRMYADRKEWDLQKADVSVLVTRDRTANITHITREIDLKGNLSEDEQARLLVIANKCPIHQILSNQIEIETVIVQANALARTFLPDLTRRFQTTVCFLTGHDQKHAVLLWFVCHCSLPSKRCQPVYREVRRPVLQYPIWPGKYLHQVY